MADLSSVARAFGIKPVRCGKNITKFSWALALVKHFLVVTDEVDGSCSSGACRDFHRSFACLWFSVAPSHILLSKNVSTIPCGQEP
jgi:hypothetical protein